MDCKDLLNICLFRPVFSPTEFIQMKGRGTRIFDFKECWKDKNQIPKTINSIKHFKDIIIVYQRKMGYGGALLEGISQTKTNFFCIINNFQLLKFLYLFP